MHPHRSLFSQHPLAQLAVAFATGICVANCFPIKLSVSIGVVCSVLTVVLLLKKRLQVAAVMLLVAVFFTGAVLVELERRSVSGSEIRNQLEQPITLTGWLDGPPEVARDRVYLSLRVEEPASGRVSLLVPLRNGTSINALQLRYGARIRVNTKLEREGDYRNPGVSTLAEFLDRNGYDASGIIKSPGSITRLENK